MGNQFSVAINTCLDGHYEVDCDNCGGTGICPTCKGEGGWVGEKAVTRTEWAKNAEERLVQTVVSVNMPDNKPCPACSNRVLMIQVASTFRGTGPFSDMNPDHRSPTKSKTDWRGTGKCAKCKGTGKITMYSSPTAKRLHMADTYDTIRVD